MDVMKKVNVLLNSPEKVGKFIQILQKFNCNFDLESGRGCVDAKSMDRRDEPESEKVCAVIHTCG